MTTPYEQERRNQWEDGAYWPCTEHSMADPDHYDEEYEPSEPPNWIPNDGRVCGIGGPVECHHAEDDVTRCEECGKCMMCNTIHGLNCSIGEIPF